jgi:glycosyltransferase involved in cell wall biosynthesis
LAERLVFIVPGDIRARTGGSIYDRRLTEALRAAGRPVDHIAWPASFPFPDEADREQARADLAALPDGALVMIDGLAFGVLPELMTAEARRLRLVALVHHPLSLETGLDAETQPRLHASETRALTAARAVVVTSAMTAKTLIEDFAVPARRIAVAEPGVDNRPQARPERAPGPVRLLSMGQVVPRKDHRTLVEALATIRNLDWTCVIAGSLERAPETAEALRDQIEAAGLQDRVALFGEADEDEAVRLYAEADLFVLPSLYEGYGMVFAEALRSGLPIVATRAGAVPDLVPAEVGLLVEPGDAGALAAALARLIGDEGFRRALTEGARAAGAKLPGWDETASKAAAALSRLA